MPRRRNASKILMDMPEKATKLSLACKQLADEITNMRCLYILWFNSRCGKGGLGYIAEKLEHAPAFAFNIAGEIALGAAQNKYFCRHFSSPSSSARCCALRFALPYWLHCAAVPQTGIGVQAA